MKNSYPVFFANSCRNNYSPAKITAKGTESWSKLRHESELGTAGHLLVSQTTVFMISSERITAVDTKGEEIWFQKKWTNSPAVLYGDLLYCQTYESKEMFERIATQSGSVLANDINAAFMCGKEQFLFFKPREKDFLACIQLAASQQLSTDGTPKSYPPRYSIFAKPYDSLDFLWVAEEREQVILPVLVCDKINRVFIGASQGIVVYNSISDEMEPQPVGRFKYPLLKVKNACADNEGNLYFIGSDDKMDQLILCDGKGNVKWKWNLAGETLNETPIAVGSNGEVFVSTGTAIHCVKDGKTLWKLSTGLLDSKFFTTTSDGHLLATTRDFLYCCKDGVEIFKVDIGSTIIAPPVADNMGCIYILTQTKLVKVL